VQARRDLTTSDGVDLAYWLWRPAADGDRLLLLLHGAASNHTRWSEFVETTCLTESWSVLAPDLRGNGESMIRGGQTPEVWSRDLIEILDAESLPAPVIVGHSLGAQIAIHLAHRYPTRVRGLVLIDPVFTRALRGRQRRIWQLRWPLRAAMVVIRSLNALGIRRRRIPLRDIRDLDETVRQALRGADSFDEIAKRYSSIWPILRFMPTVNYLAQLNATVEPLPSLSTIQVPVAVLLSSKARLPRGEVITIGANHWPLTEAPHETRKAIEDWIGKTFEH
jgi:pimeloyl-ACP methyl ester carboxylesterase